MKLTSKGGLGTIGDGGKKKPIPLTEAQLSSFGNFGGTADVKGKAAYLMKKGLINGGQLYTDHPDISSKNGIINAQSDWKTSAISQMLMRARSLNLQNPTQVAANRKALLGALPDRLQQAINHPEFAKIHPNWWETFDSVLKDQYASENNTAPSLSNLITKK